MGYLICRNIFCFNFLSYRFKDTTFEAIFLLDLKGDRYMLVPNLQDHFLQSVVSDRMKLFSSQSESDKTSEGDHGKITSKIVVNSQEKGFLIYSAVRQV